MPSLLIAGALVRPMATAKSMAVNHGHIKGFLNYWVSPFAMPSVHNIVTHCGSSHGLSLPINHSGTWAMCSLGALLSICGLTAALATLSLQDLQEVSVEKAEVLSHLPTCRHWHNTGWVFVRATLGARGHLCPVSLATSISVQ